MTDDVLLARPVAASTVCEGVRTGVTDWHGHGDGPDAVSIIIRHGVVTGNAEVVTTSEVNSFWRNVFVGHVDLPSNDSHLGRSQAEKREKREGKEMFHLDMVWVVFIQL